MSKNIIDAIDNLSENLKGENVDSVNIIDAIDNLAEIMESNGTFAQSITIGETTLDEEKLQALLNLLV